MPRSLSWLLLSIVVIALLTGCSKPAVATPKQQTYAEALAVFDSEQRALDTFQQQLDRLDASFSQHDKLQDETITVSNETLAIEAENDPNDKAGLRKKSNEQIAAMAVSRDRARREHQNNHAGIANELRKQQARLDEAKVARDEAYNREHPKKP